MERPRHLLPLLAAVFLGATLGQGVAAAQPRSADPAVPSLPVIGFPLPTLGLPLPTLGLPLPSLGLPLPPLGLPPRAENGTPRTPSGRHTEGPRRPRHRSRGPSAIYFVSPYPWGWMPSGGSQTGSSVPGVVAEPPEEERSGTIRLDVEPAVPFQIYVDSYFVGTSNDLGNTLGLEAGPHRIEIRAEGYAPHVFDTKVAPGLAITYQARLEPLEAPQAPEASEPAPQDPASGTAPAPGPTTIYFIPGCYLGNLPPDALKMPAGCDLARLQTYKP